MTEPTSDFPEFDKAYQSVLVKDLTDRFEQLAAQANFNVYHSDIWRGTGRKFAELIVRECADVARGWTDIYVVEDNAPRQIDEFMIQHFGVE
jgi:hypothetical protein